MATVQELRKALEECFELNKKFFAPNQNTKKIIDKILENISPQVMQQIDPQELKQWQKSPTMKKILVHSLVAAHDMLLSPRLYDPKFAKDPALVLPIELLFKYVLKPHEQKKLEKLLKHTNPKVRKEDQLDITEILKYNTKQIEKFLKMHGKELKHDPDADPTQRYNRALLGTDPQGGGLPITVFEDVLNRNSIADTNNQEESDSLSRSAHASFNPNPFKTKFTPPGSDPNN